MSAQINQPSNQIRLTNVSLVRMRKAKKRYEIACYKNKVLEWRNGVEKDLDEVLQIHQVFTNVSKGAVAPTSDLQKSFPNMKQEDIILEILKKGELQVGEKERSQQLEQIHNEVLQIVTEKCVDPGSNRPYTVGMIEKALAELMTSTSGSDHAHGGGHAKEEKGGGSNGGGAAGGGGEKSSGDKEKEKDEEAQYRWTGVVTNKSAKSQALDAIRALVHHQPIAIARARMRLRIQLPGAAAKKIKSQVVELVEEVLEEEFGQDGWNAEVMCEPGKYRQISEVVGREARGKGRVEVIEMAVVTGEGND